MSTQAARDLLARAVTMLQNATGLVIEAIAALEEPGVAPPITRPGARRMVVCVDAGHGGTDPGAHSGDGKTQEKTLTLAYAQNLKTELTSRGHRVVMTRETDVFVPLADRSKISNDAGADCFVSIHANAADSKLANGAWVIHDDLARTGPGSGTALALAIFDALAKVPGVVDADAAAEVFPDDSPPVGGRDLAVLGGTRAPAALVELGFLTNEDDLAQLGDPVQLGVVSAAIASGLEAWRRASPVPPT